MKKDDTSTLQQLGNKQTKYIYSDPCKEMLEVFPNKFPKNDYVVSLETKEFTSLCPKTGQPDFAIIKIEYTPKKLCVETKSLKLYLFAFRNSGTFMETITNQIMEDLVSVLNPKYLKVEGVFNSRGGIGLIVEAQYGKK